MRRLRAPFALLAVAALAAVGLTPAPRPAMAATDYLTVVSRTFSAGPGPYSSLLTCPVGTHVVAVGFAGIDPPLYLNGTSFDRRISGLVSVRNTGPDPHRFTAYTLCLDAGVTGVTGVTYPYLQRTVSPGSVTGLIVGCPAGTQQVAGAGRAVPVPGPPLGTVLVTGSYPGSRVNPTEGWSTYVNNRAAGARDVLVQARASCIAVSPLRVEIATAIGVPAPPGVTDTRVACPAKTEIAGGGFRAPSFGPIEERGNLLAAVASRPIIPTSLTNPEAWAVRVRNNASVDTSFSAYAVCVSLA